ncbi:MAG: DUF234 domain-containing protein, partial [Actinomycetota bacterium]
DRYRAEIQRGLGRSILPVLIQEIDDHMGSRWEEALRMHLRMMADRGELGPEVIAVGPFWTTAGDGGEIDAVVLAGRRRDAILVGEAKWARRVEAPLSARGSSPGASSCSRSAAGDHLN